MLKTYLSLIRKVLFIIYQENCHLSAFDTNHLNIILLFSFTVYDLLTSIHITGTHNCFQHQWL